MQALLFAVKTHKMRKVHIDNWNEHHRSYFNETLSADIACQDSAVRAGVPGVFVALLSTSRRSIGKIISLQQSDNIPIINSQVRKRLLNCGLNASFILALLMYQSSHDCHPMNYCITMLCE